MSWDLIRMDNYGGLWSLEESRVEGFLAECELQLNLFRSMSGDQLRAAIEARTEKMKSEANAGYDLADGVATFRLSGTMTKHGSSFSPGSSTARAQQAIREASRNGDVKAAMFVIDSPGGSVLGLQSLANEWRDLSARIPTVGVIEDMGCSAAYWVISQSGRLMARPGSLVGSIGVFQAVNDYSAAAAKDGVKVHVIRSGQFKGAGVPGTEVTASQLAEWQRQCDECYAEFVSAVAAGRKMSPDSARLLADGRVHGAAAAVGMGLIDAVSDEHTALDELRRQISSGKKTTVRSVKATEGGSTLFTSSKRPIMTHAEVVAACGADYDKNNIAHRAFVADQLAIEGSTELSVFKAFAGFLRAEDKAQAAKELEAAQAKAKTAQEAADKAASDAAILAHKPGHSNPLKGGEASKGGGGAASSDQQLVEQFDERVQAYIAKHPGIRPIEATIAVSNADREFAAAVHAANARLCAAQAG